MDQRNQLLATHPLVMLPTCTKTAMNMNLFNQNITDQFITLQHLHAGNDKSHEGFHKENSIKLQW